MTSINPYINYYGNCEEAFNLYKDVFGGDFSYVGRYKDMPPQKDCPEVAEEDKQKILHISLPIGECSVLMGSDVLKKTGDPINPNITISINVATKEESDRIFNHLSKGGKVIMPLADTFWGAYFGMFTDRFGVQWMINCELKK